jgi:hypothetical protein
MTTTASTWEKNEIKMTSTTARSKEAERTGRAMVQCDNAGERPRFANKGSACECAPLGWFEERLGESKKSKTC